MARSTQSYRNYAFAGALPVAGTRHDICGHGLCDISEIQRIAVKATRSPRQKINNSAMHSRKIALGFLSILGITLCIVSAAGMVSSKSSSVPVLTPNHLEEMVLSSSAPVSRADFLAKLNNVKRREVASQIHYVSQIISKSNSKVENPESIATAIVRQSRLANVDPLLVTAVIKAESTFKNHATSITGAQGLMQLMPDTGRYIARKIGGGKASLRDPEENIRLGIAYLKYLENYFGNDRKKILIAYNWGPANLLDALKNGKPALASSRDYAQKVIDDHRRWHGDFQTRVAQYRYMNLDKLMG